MKTEERQSLLEEIASLRKEFFNLKLSATSGQLKDYSQFKKIRKKIARALTTLNANQNS